LKIANELNEQTMGRDIFQKFPVRFLPKCVYETKIRKPYVFEL
jgi:hypothetical protein